MTTSQLTLFGSKVNQSKYPREWVYRGHTGGIKEDITIQVKDISIVEDFTIPDFFVDFIDWDRIRKRLTNKLNKLTDVTNDERDEEDE